MFQFIHGADLHLGSPFFGIGRLLPGLRERLAAAPESAWRKLVELALAEKVAFVVLAGDVFDTPEPGLAQLLALRNGLEKLSEAGIPCFIAAGNHDTISSFSRLKMPENTVIFLADNVTEINLPCARVCGIGHAAANEKRNLAKRFAALLPSALPTVAVLHANVGGDPDFEPYAPAALADLTENPVIDYWALGHIHKRRILHDSAPVAAYSGTTQSCHVNVPGACGVYLVRCGEEKKMTVEFRECGDVRFGRKTISCADLTDFDALLSEVSKLGNSLREESDGVLTVLELVLDGRSPLADFVASQVPEDLADALQTNLGKEIQLAHVSNRLRRTVERDELLRGSHLAAAVAELTEEMKNDGCAVPAETWKALRRSFRQLPEMTEDELRDAVEAAENDLFARLADAGGGR